MCLGGVASPRLMSVSVSVLIMAPKPLLSPKLQITLSSGRLYLLKSSILFLKIFLCTVQFTLQIKIQFQPFSESTLENPNQAFFNPQIYSAYEMINDCARMTVQILSAC